MADKTVTAASVLSSGVNAGAIIKTGVAGATITAGMVLYKDTGDSNKLKAADANGSALLRVIEGVALNGAGAGQPVEYCQYDPSFIPGFTVYPGETLIASATPGLFGDDADAIDGWYKTILGIGISTTAIKLGPFMSSGVAADVP